MFWSQPQLQASHPNLWMPLLIMQHLLYRHCSSHLHSSLTASPMQSRHLPILIIPHTPLPPILLFLSSYAFPLFTYPLDPFLPLNLNAHHHLSLSSTPFSYQPTPPNITNLMHMGTTTHHTPIWHLLTHTEPFKPTSFQCLSTIHTHHTQDASFIAPLLVFYSCIRTMHVLVISISH